MQAPKDDIMSGGEKGRNRCQHDEAHQPVSWPFLCKDWLPIKIQVHPNATSTTKSPQCIPLHYVDQLKGKSTK